ncbi:MAG: SLC13 family permease [Deltaproteobacteria bacterium]|nr:SLC13 family permease [Deltaproteobacteria bacterium]
MTGDQLTVFGILGATLVLFVWGRWRYDLVALAALLLVYLAGLIGADQLFLGFGHPAVVTVAAVLIISRGLLNAGVVDALSRQLSRVGTRPVAQVTALTAIVIVCSGFMNNVGALALLMPVAIWMSRRSGRSPSLLLMPLAFGSLVGGLITLIGTPPNIIIALFREQTGQPAFGMFDFTPVGAAVALAGLAFISLIGWRLTPKRETQDSPDELFEIDSYLSEILIPEDSEFVGKTVFHLISAMEQETEASVVDLVRDDRHLPAPSSYMIIQAGDILMVEADSEDLKTLVDGLGLRLAESKTHPKATLGSEEVRIMETVVAADSPLVGSTAAVLDLRHRYGVNLLAIARRGRRLRRQLGQTRLIIGDILLLQGTDAALQTLLKDCGCLPLAERGLQMGRPSRILSSVGIFIAAMLLSTFNVLPVQVAFVAAAVLMILVGLISLKEIYESVDWPIIVLLGALFPLGHALESTGGARLIAEKMLILSGHLPPMGTLAVLLVGTMLLSNVVNNAAAAVLMAPIALTLAEGMAVSADPLLMAVAVGASCAFLTPVGHQSNALVMAPGGYQFGDYWHLGLPLSLIVAGVAVPLIPLFWPF